MKHGHSVVTERSLDTGVIMKLDLQNCFLCDPVNYEQTVQGL